MFKKTANEFASKLKELQQNSNIKAPETQIQEKPVISSNRESSYRSKLPSQEQTKLPSVVKPSTTPNDGPSKKLAESSLAQKPTD